MSRARISSLWGKITVLVIICFFALSARAKYGGGQGTAAEPYLIYEPNQMNEIGLSVNWDDWDKHFKLMADIDLSAFTVTDFNIIGTDYDNAFTGVFDGNGNTISNFTCTSTDRDHVGLFGYVTGGTIKDLGLIDPNVNAGTGSGVGSLVYYLKDKGTVTGCYAQGGSVSGRGIVGGLVGINEGTISNCYSSAVSVSGDWRVGGLVGWNGSTRGGIGIITDCYASGDVSGNDEVGGLVGYNYAGIVTNCYSAGSVSGDWHVGGLVGENCGTIINCTSSASVSGNYSTGGLVAWNYGIITNCSAAGDVSGDERVGGLVGGIGLGAITNCYATGSVSGDERVGGLVGWTSDGTITNCYSAGSVSGDWHVGGLVGDNRYGSITSSFWDVEASGQAESAGGTGLSTAEMQEINTFLTEGWDFVGEILNGANDYWQISPGDYPRLSYTVMPEGLGTAQEPYLIRDARDLGTVRLNPFAHYRLEASVDLSGITWSMAVIPQFWGGFDGNGHVISNLHIQGHGDLGLFGQLRYGAEISNLGLEAEDVNGIGDYVGGLAAFNGGSITTSYSTGTVSGNDYVGGLVAFNEGSITTSYSTGTVSGNDYVGGLVGYNMFGSITMSYSTGAVSGTADVGGLVGYGGYGGYEGTISNSFWDIETSGQTTSAGGGTGKTTAEMQMMSTFTDASWDFTTPVWTIDEGVDYPRLWWELVPVLHTEPEVTLWTSNTITWDPVVGANDYYAECAEDANFTSIIYNTGWITETSYEFTGLEIGKRYWYSVKTRNTAGVETNWSNVESSLQLTLADAVDILLDPDTLKNKNMKNALLNKINAVQQMIADGLYADALNKLQNDILQKTDGCAETGRPDKNDWIITCEEQGELYPLVIETIEYVSGLMNQ